MSQANLGNTNKLIRGEIEKSMYNICMQLQVAEREAFNKHNRHSNILYFKNSECPVKDMGNQSHYGFGTLYWGKKSYIDGCLAQTYLPYDQMYLQYEVVRRRPIIVLYIFSRNNYSLYIARWRSQYLVRLII